MEQEKHFNLTDTEFEQQFADLTLDPTWFTHEAHLRLAWIHIKKYGIEIAIDHICDQIQRFARAHGDTDKYNVTVTIAAVRAVYHFILKSGSDTFQGYISEFLQLKTEFKKLLDSHYSLDIFKSELGQKTFVDPDLAPF